MPPMMKFKAPLWQMKYDKPSRLHGTTPKDRIWQLLFFQRRVPRYQVSI